MTKPTYKNIGDKIVVKLSEDIAAKESDLAAASTDGNNQRAMILRLELNVLRAVKINAIEVIMAETGKYDG